MHTDGRSVWHKRYYGVSLTACFFNCDYLNLLAWATRHTHTQHDSRAQLIGATVASEKFKGRQIPLAFKFLSGSLFAMKRNIYLQREEFLVAT